jgi:molybdopterin-guanine dinucleotide biosynthesis protein A
MPSPSVSVVVLAGGRSTRFGADKLAAPLRGTTVLDHLLDALPAGWPVVIVGQERATRRAVTWTNEDPPGGGPLAALLAGVAVARAELVAVVAGDMPEAAPAVERLVAVLTAAGPEVEAAVGVDDEGVPNPLLAVYRRDAVAARAALPTAGVPARSLLTLAHAEVAVPGRAAHDVDTRADLDSFGGQA